MIKSIWQKYTTRKEFTMLVFLSVSFSVCALLLSGANVAYQKASAIFERRLYAVILTKAQIPFQEDGIETTFATHFELHKIGNTIYYIGKDPQRRVVVFKTQGPGLWSTIELVLAVAPDFEHLEWLSVLAQAETPGLGGRIMEDEFQARFNGVEIRPELRVVKFASAPNEVDAITGASKTSEALQKILNKAIREFDQAFGKGM